MQRGVQMTFATIPPVNAPRTTNPNCPPGFSSLPYLSDLWHPTTGEHMQFEPYLYESSAPLERASTAYSVPGADSAIDPMGVSGNPVSPRQLTTKFLRPYGPGEN